MPPRRANPLQNGSNNSYNYSLANTKAAYRDLLVFEERLKHNSMRLSRQRLKYEAFLGVLVAAIAVLAYLLSCDPSNVINAGLLLISLVTLLLFFATGVYSEKIAYAYKFVPQANRALRYFNIYLNTKQRSSSYSLLNPLRLFYRSQSQPQPLIQNSARSTSPRSGTARSQSVPLAPIPPASNPRGELIFSSKVSAPYREGYEKYRADWEKKRKLAKHELGWRDYIGSFFSSSSSRTNKPSAASTTESSEKQPSVVYPASPPVTLTGSTSTTTSRGRDSRARPLLRTNSSSSLSSAFSASPPQSRRSSPLRNSAGTADSSALSSPRSSLPPTPDLIREEDEEEGLDSQEYFEQPHRAGQHSIRRVHSASEDSVLQSPDEAEVSPERPESKGKSSQHPTSAYDLPSASDDFYAEPSTISRRPSKYRAPRSRAEGLNNLLEKLSDARTEG